MSRARAAIAGVGESDVGRRTGRTALALHLEAATRALADAALDAAAIDGVISRPIRGGAQTNYAGTLASRLGIEPAYVCDVALGGASSAAMILTAAAAIEAGYCTTVLCVNGDAQTARANAGGGGWSEAFERPFGVLGAPVQYALAARRHMHEYGTTSEQLGAIAVTCRNHAALAPNAVARTPITLADHQASRMVADPLHLLDCCPVTDGAAAVVVTTPERARAGAQPPVYLLGGGQHASHAEIQYAPSMTTVAMRGASQAAYAMAGLGPADIDVAELYDAFTSVVLVTLEDYGFCAKGDGGAFAASGAIALGGAIPVNTAGGLLSQVHAGGFFLITEAATQVRGAAGARQVAGARTAIVSGQCSVTGLNVCLIFGTEVPSG